MKEEELQVRKMLGIHFPTIFLYWKYYIFRNNQEELQAGKMLGIPFPTISGKYQY